MANIVRRGLFDDTFEDTFRGFMVRPFSYEAPLAPQFRMDVTETDDAYRVTADLPGVNKDDIGVTVAGDTVTVTAEVRGEEERAGCGEG